jgi:hypothetical protein
MRVLYQPMRFALCLCLCLAACHKESPKPIDPPPDYLGVVSMASLDGALARFGAYANAVSPGAGAAVRTEGAMMLLANLVSAGSLAGVATDRPMHLVILDPKKHARPLVLLAGVTDAQKLKAGVGELEARIQDGRALIGAKAEVEATAAWAFAALKDAPAAPTLRVDLGRVVDRYRPDIESMRKQIKPLLAQSPGAGRILEAEIAIMLRLAAQTRELTISLDASAEEADLEIVLAPNAGSGMETFIKEQRPMSPALLGKLTGLDRAAYVLAGDYHLGAAREEMYALLSGFFGDLLGAAPDAAWKQRFNAWLDHFNGPVAGVMAMGASGFAFQQVAEVDDGARTVAEAKALFPLASPRTFEFMGMKVTVSLSEGPIDEYVFKLGFETLPERQREMMRRLYGDEVHLAMTAKDKLFYVAWGKDAGADAKALLAVDAGAVATLPPAVKAAFDSAVARKCTYVAFMDLAKAMGAILGAADAKTESGVLLDITFTGGDLRTRIGVPSAHIRSIMASVGKH